MEYNIIVMSRMKEKKTYHPKIGGQVIAKARTHTIKIIIKANRLERLFLEYVNG